MVGLVVLVGIDGVLRFVRKMWYDELLRRWEVNFGLRKLVVLVMRMFFDMMVLGFV